MWPHLAVDTVNIVLCVLIAREAWRRYVGVQSAFHLMWASSFAIMAVAEVAHAVLPIVSGQSVGIPSIWAAGRFVLAVVFYVGILDAHRIIHYKSKDVAVLLTLSALLAVLATSALGMSMVAWSQPVAYEVTHVAGAVLAVTWLACIPLVYLRPYARIQMPRGFVLFVLLGVGVHIAMSLSTGPFDRWLWIGHGLKIAEYGVWLLSSRSEERKSGVRGTIIAKGAIYDEVEAALDLLRESSQRATELARRIGGNGS